MKMTKLKAFTLTEMLVVLVVATIVISMAFLVLNMVRKQVISIQNNYQKKQEVQLFETTFSRDFNARSAFYHEQLNVLVLKNSKDIISYIFLQNAIVREKDTFQIQVANKKLFLDGIQVKEKTIDAIEINLSDQFANRQLFIHRTKDATYYLNIN
jgi:prepilin-type N-terminal cleavage/methylation domain-containing protein